MVYVNLELLVNEEFVAWDNGQGSGNFEESLYQGIIFDTKT